MTPQHVEQEDVVVVVLLLPVEPGGGQHRGATRVPLPPAPGAPHLLLLPGSDQVEDTGGDQAGHLDRPDVLGVRAAG